MDLIRLMNLAWNIDFIMVVEGGIELEFQNQTCNPERYFC